MLHEKMENSSSDSEETESSDEGEPIKIEPSKKYIEIFFTVVLLFLYNHFYCFRKKEISSSSSNHYTNSNKATPPAKRKRNSAYKVPKQVQHVMVCRIWIIF